MIFTLYGKLEYWWCIFEQNHRGLGLRKSYGDVQAVKGLDFYIESGKIFAFPGRTAPENPRRSISSARFSGRMP
jgi:hypothetical protein